ncbi:hypothetical protein [Bacillus sp. B1-b2]|uniref:hypothetical protein n=1 Tax=Bacillus sp. B1-b2 TaxID=2653201 RepID=UPI001D0184F9|nr:hypothetical protein [Bacillus sp. B1-b2]
MVRAQQKSNYRNKKSFFRNKTESGCNEKSETQIKEVLPQIKWMEWQIKDSVVQINLFELQIN